MVRGLSGVISDGLRRVFNERRLFWCRLSVEMGCYPAVGKGWHLSLVMSCIHVGCSVLVLFWEADPKRYTDRQEGFPVYIGELPPLDFPFFPLYTII